jgi:hypothetical protein
MAIGSAADLIAKRSACTNRVAATSAAAACAIAQRGHRQALLLRGRLGVAGQAVQADGDEDGLALGGAPAARAARASGLAWLRHRKRTRETTCLSRS